MGTSLQSQTDSDSKKIEDLVKPEKLSSFKYILH